MRSHFFVDYDFEKLAVKIYIFDPSFDFAWSFCQTDNLRSKFKLKEFISIL